ncbi:hypothetical protein [Occallatibacter riparius]|uniref:Flagellar protein FliL n=1 Tax=Occallatibacter riparius TaxID=1002689 RepID=A0A9J7BSB8_9BACT|nr:hypothetical protein [Occallatibacter riparius]UWZ84658.1 hypothetical protein MOP44_01685 [Occallatibacter riparius]
MQVRLFVLFIVVAVSLFVGAAHAQAQAPIGRHIDFTAKLLDLNSHPIALSEKDPTQVTLSYVCINALETPVDADREMAGEQKFAMDQLARKIYAQKDVVLSAEEITLLKKRVGMLYGPLVVGAAWRMLDSDAAEKK